MDTLQTLNLNRFLYKTAPQDSVYDPSAYILNQNNLPAPTTTGSAGGFGGGSGGNGQANAIAQGTVIQSSLVQTTGGAERVELNPGGTANVPGIGTLDIPEGLWAYHGGIPSTGIRNGQIFTSRPIFYGGYIMPRQIGAGFVNSVGTPGTVFPTGWTVSNLATGRYKITHNLNRLDYIVLATPLAGTTRTTTIESANLNDFIVRVADLSPALIDTDFSFAVMTNPQ